MPEQVTGVQQRWRREFNDPSLDDWKIKQTGVGMAAVAGNGTLVLTTGITANDSWSITSENSFTVPFKASFGLKLSQKIANQEFYFEVIAAASDGTDDEAVVAAWRISGTDSVTTTNARTEVRNGGAARLQSANIASQATQTVDSVYEISVESDETWFHSKAADSTAGRFASSVRNTTSPDPSRQYRVRIRAVNGAVAPASSTTLTCSFVAVVDYTEFNVELTGGQGNVSPGQAVPVYPVSSPTTLVNISASATSTGTTNAKVFAAATTNATSVKTTAARVFGYDFANTSAAWKFVKFFNKASAPVVGTDVPVFTIGIPPNGNVSFPTTIPLTFATGLAYAITGAVADNDVTAVAVGDVIGHIDYL